MLGRGSSCKLHAAAAAGATPANDAVPPWRQVVAVTAGCLLLCNLHRSTFAVLLPDLATQLGLRASQAGAVQAAMLAAYLAGQVPAGRLADKYSGTRVLLWGLCLWSLATALTAAAGLAVGTSSSSSWWPLAVIILSRVLLGLASACAMPCVAAMAVQWVPAAERASAISFTYANFNLGGVIGLTMVPLLADAFGGGGAFVISGAVGVAWAAVGAMIMQRVTAQHAAAGGRSKAEGAATGDAAAAGQGKLIAGSRQQGQQQQQPKQQQPPPPFSWQLDAASTRQVALLCFAHAVIGFGFFLMQNWMPLYMASLGSQGLAVTGRLSSMPWLAAAVAGMLAGSAADSLIRSGLPTLSVRRLMQCISFAGCGLSVVPLALTTTPGLIPAVLCLTANLTFYSLSYGGFHAYLQDVAGAKAGVLQGVTNSASILAGLLGSLLTGWVVDATGSYSAVFWVLAALYGVAAVVWAVCSSSHKLGEQVQ
uniref:Major facilitator superfamily (MFS) profile domain-containing protein n=1 Tax=Tetradesmus obliquus TaxID=3088 RepID=A0A383VPL3_TETOB|eukprot:jgi/Sobl393_1/18266/SZX77863.1